MITPHPASSNAFHHVSGKLTNKITNRQRTLIPSLVHPPSWPFEPLKPATRRDRHELPEERADPRVEAHPFEARVEAPDALEHVKRAQERNGGEDVGHLVGRVKESRAGAARFK